jgi:small-conductance mechanosensitive channel
MAKLQQDLALIRRNVGVLDDRVQGKRLKLLPLTNLDTLERYLSFLDRELRQWQTALQAVSGPVSADAATLVGKRRQWLETRQALDVDMVPALAQRIDSLLDDFGRAEAALSKPLKQQLQLGREAGALQTRVNTAASAVAAQIASIDQLLWRRDTVNLFTALASAEPQDRIDLGTFFEEIGNESDLLDEFDRYSRAVHNGVLLLSAVLLPVMLLLSARAKRAFPGDPGLERHRRALTRPLSAWLLLTLSLLILVLYYGPATRIKVLMLLAWLPIMRLQPAYIRTLLGHGIHFTGLFIVLAVLCQMLTSMSLLFRLLVLFSSLSMLAVLGWLWLRLTRARQQRDSGRLRLLRNVIGGGALIAAVAAAANLIGNITLAAMLNEAALSGAYTALYLLAASNSVRAWLRYIFRPTAERLQVANQHARGLLPVLGQLFDLALLLVWLYFTLDAFRVLRPLQAWLETLFAFRLGFGSISVTIGGVALFCVSVFLSFWMAKTARGVLAEDVLPRLTLPRGVANSVSTMTYYAVVLLGLMVALSAAGFEVSQLALVLGALSVGIGFGLQTVVNNFVSGMILMFERPIQPGDTVEVAGTIGTIRDIGMRATTFTTFEGADVVVPNGMLLSEKLINWTLSTNIRRIDLPVGVAYGSDPAAVAELLVKVANATDGVLRHPAPTVLFTGFGASSLDFSVRAWASYDDHVFVRSRMALAVHAALQDAGIEIPFPQQDLHLRSIEPGLFDKLQPKGDAPGG